MNIKDILQRDPASNPLANKGQARIADCADEKVLQELRAELSTFVCEGQYADGIQRILSSFLTCLSQTSQKAAWVSGFFGSGKSHLLKMLCHLWRDTKFPDGATARSLVPYMPDDLQTLLRELDTQGKRAGGLLAAAGSLPGGATYNVRQTVLSVLFRAVGLPDQYPQARFCLWLYDQGFLDKVKSDVEKAGKTWESELNNLYVSGPLARAVLQCDGNFASHETKARETIRDQFPRRDVDVTTMEFLNEFKRALRFAGRDGRAPCTALILDEVQQYIGESNERSTFITEVAEAVSKQLDSHVILVGAGQSALTEMRLLHKLMDRFTIRVPLSDADVETVTRKVLLQKKPTKIGEVRRFLDSNSGEISRQLQGTRIGENAQDRDIIVDDYPLLPVRRRFWEHCFRAIDAAGTHSQLRSQLQIIHDVVARLSSRPIGALVPGDELYEALAPEMVNTGVLLREINERIIGLSKDGSLERRLARRVCGLIFLIGKLSREAGADIGVRASKEHIADLLVDDLLSDNGKLRSAVGEILEKLAGEGVLMKVGDEYRLQTREGTEWDREFRTRQAHLANNDADIQIRRDQILYAEADKVIRSIKPMNQGAANEARDLAIFRDQTPPRESGESIWLWIRDGWSASEKDVVDAAREAGMNSPLVFVFIPRQSANDLRKWIVDAEAAQQTIDAKGVPTTSEGEEARQSMESRRNLAVRQRDELVKQIVGNAKVFQGGGSELLQPGLDERLKDAANAALIRLFPRFKEADSAAWGAAVKRAKEGSDQPFSVVGHSGPTEQHPVCQQVLSIIGAGMTGNEIRKTLRASPFGWPQDAIDAALIALHRSQHVSAILNGAPVAPGQLDQNKISKSEFRVERITLGVTDRLALRKLFQALGVSCKSGEEPAKAPAFLDSLIELAEATGGNPPLPASQRIADIEDLKRLAGNDLLAGIRDRAADFEQRIKEWSKGKAMVDSRMPVWNVVERLARHSAALPSAAEQLKQVEAIKSQRLLLEPTDPVSPLRTSLSNELRKALQEAQAKHQTAHSAGVAALKSSDAWDRISETARTNILSEVGLTDPVALDVSSDDVMLASVDLRPLAARQAEADAVPGRVQRAIEEAAKLLEPKVRSFAIERATLRTEEDVRKWGERQVKGLLAEIKEGPVLIK